MKVAAYDVFAADLVRDRAQALSIWHGNLGDDERMPSKYDWFYLDGPHGQPGPATLAILRHRDSDARVGAVGAGPRRMLWRGAPVTAGLMVDFAVVAGHRSLGPALILQREAMALALAQADLLYALPNERAAPVYQRAGYRHAGDLVRHARVLRHGGYLARHLPRPLAACAGALLDLADRLRLRLRSRPLRAEWTDAASDEMDRLWADSAHGEGLVTIRDAAYLRWRFDRNPLAGTRYLLLRDDDGSLLAWFACRREDAALVVDDYWATDAIAGIARARVDALLVEARRLGCAAVWIELAGATARTRAWRANGFRPRSARPLFLFSADMAPQPGADDLFLTGADEDE